MVFIWVLVLGMRPTRASCMCLTTKLCSQLTEKFERIQKTEIKDLLVILLGQPYSIWGESYFKRCLF